MKKRKGKSAMDFGRVDNYINALLLARRCMKLGARIKTTMLLTGLPHTQLSEFFRYVSPRGRIPNGASWQIAPKQVAEASVFAAILQEILDQEMCDLNVAVVTAYEIFRCQGVNESLHVDGMTFDSAVNLVCQIKGVWLRTEPNLVLRSCPKCQALCLWNCRCVDSAGIGCAFCFLAGTHFRKNRLPAIRVSNMLMQ